MDLSGGAADGHRSKAPYSAMSPRAAADWRRPPVSFFLLQAGGSRNQTRTNIVLLASAYQAPISTKAELTF